MNAGAWIEKGGSGREFQLWRSEPVALVGIMELGSLREALRAGRAILQHEEFRVMLGSRWWEGHHSAR
jgi:hypothetical protein